MSDIHKILVIEPKPLLSKQMKRQLNKKRTIVFMVKEMTEAFELLKFVYFDILVVDIQAGQHQSAYYQAILSIQWMSPQIRIILIISKEKIKYLNNLEGLEISNVILKPIKEREVMVSINQALEKAELCCPKT